MPSVLSSAFSTLLTDGEKWNLAFLSGVDGEPGQPELFSQITNVALPGQTPAGPTVNMISVAALAGPESFPEGQEIPTANPTQGYTKTLTHSMFGRGVEIHDNVSADDQTGVIERQIAALGATFRTWAEQKAARIYNKAFVTTDFTGGDGLALCTTSHTVPGSASTLSNQVASNPVLSDTNFNTAWKMLVEQKNYAELPMGLMPTHLIVPPALMQTASAILGSDKKPGGDYNDVNPFANMGIRLIVNPWMGAAAGGSDTAWFLINRPMIDLWYWMRTPIISSQERDQSKLLTKYLVNHRASFGFNNWFGIVGSSGLGS